MGVQNTVTVTVKAKLDVPTETAETCLKLIEAWVNYDNRRKVLQCQVETDGGIETRLYLEEEKKSDERDES